MLDDKKNAVLWLVFFFFTNVQTPMWCLSILKNLVTIWRKVVNIFDNASSLKGKKKGGEGIMCGGETISSSLFLGGSWEGRGRG